MNISQFDGNAAFSGGGFMPSQATDTAAEPSSFAPTKDRESHVLLPLTIKQICAAANPSDDRINIVVDGVEANSVRLVGIMMNKAERVSDLTFELHDGTGRIDCTKWIDDASMTREMEKFVDGMYVRIHGQLKALMGKRQLTVFSIREVKDFNEIPAHFMECIYVHLYNTSKRHGGANMQPQVTNVPYQPGSSQFPGRYNTNTPGIKSTVQLVLEYMNQPSCMNIEKGVRVEEIARQLNLSIGKVMEVIRPLEAEGLLYNTIDEHHFKSTANG